MGVRHQEKMEFAESSVSIQSLILFVLAITVGLLVALLVLPVFLPNLAFSMSGDHPKAYWYLSRGTAFVSLSLLWISMALGLGMTNKMARLWPGAPASFAIHEYVSLLGLAFALFHALVLLGDHYIDFDLAQILLPFATREYHPFWVGLGQLGFYLWMIVAFSFYLRQGIGQKTWRFIHYASFALYLMALLHGIFSGTDSQAGWSQSYYWFSISSVLFLFVVRVIGTVIDKLFPADKSLPAQIAQ